MHPNAAGVLWLRRLSLKCWFMCRQRVGHINERLSLNRRRALGPRHPRRRTVRPESPLRPTSGVPDALWILADSANLIAGTLEPSRQRTSDVAIPDDADLSLHELTSALRAYDASLREHLKEARGSRADDPVGIPIF